MCKGWDCSCLSCVYSEVVVYNIHTQSKLDVSERSHCNTCRRTLVTVRLWRLHLVPFGICTTVKALLLLLLTSLELSLSEAFYHGWKCAWIFGDALYCINFFWWRLERNVNNFNIRSVKYLSRNAKCDRRNSCMNLLFSFELNSTYVCYRGLKNLPFGHVARGQSWQW